MHPHIHTHTLTDTLTPSHTHSLTHSLTHLTDTVQVLRYLDLLLFSSILGYSVAIFGIASLTIC